MKYKFTVKHIPKSFLEEHLSMSPDHPDFIKASVTSDFELGYAEDFHMDRAEENLIMALEADGCHVLSVHGARLE